MRIIVDADSCSKIRQIEEIAEEKGLPVMLFCDTTHQLYSDYSKIKKVAPGRDASSTIHTTGNGRYGSESTSPRRKRTLNSR